VWTSRSDRVTYRPIGVVASPVREAIRPELIRGVESRLVLEPGFEPAVAALEVGAHLVVVYHLHRAEAWDARPTDELFTRRSPWRPNPIGVTLVRVVATKGWIISVIGLDAIDGSPILDIKPYKPLFDEPPVEPRAE
jgi:tRNA-Thr(GGU) m(6)t(6)A37 methyltransferase TsaA